MEHTIRASGVNPFDRSYYPLQQKFDRRVLRLLSDALKVSISVVENPLVTNLAVYHETPDTWVIEQIVNGTAEMSAASVVLTPEFPQVARYSYEIGTFRPQVYYRATSLRENSNIYLLPFQTNLWVCLIAIVLLLTLTLAFILSREAKLPHEISYDVLHRIMEIQEDRDDDWAEDLETTSKESLLQREKWETGEILLVCLGALCQQGAARDPSTNAARLLLLVLFVLAVVGYTAYSASVISLISLFPSTEHELTDTLVNFSKEYKVLLRSINNIYYNPQLGGNLMEFTTLEEGFDKTIRGDAVFVGDRDISLTFLHQQSYTPDQRCMLGRVSLGTEYHKVFLFKKNSTYFKEFNQNILRMRQFGLIFRETKRTFNTHPPCTSKERSTRATFVSFDQKDVEPVLHLFIFGILLSLVVLTIENIAFYCSKGVAELLKKFKIRKKKISRGKKENSPKTFGMELKTGNCYSDPEAFYCHRL